MKTAICAIAKYENAYINDWVNYHLALGFDKIYIYDDNEDDYPYVGDFIENKENVIIIKFNEYIKDHIKNPEAYTDFLNNYAEEFDWVAFIDIDEYIYLNNYTIKDFLSNAPEECNYIGLVWKIYNDNNIVIGNENIPVNERFTNTIWVESSRMFKSIIRTHGIKHIYKSAHSFTKENDYYDYYNYYNYKFERINIDSNSIISEDEDTLKNHECYIKHFMTKSLSEFIKYKYPRYCLEQQSLPGNCALDYFFGINEITQEKLDYIKDTLNIDFEYLKHEFK